MRRGSRKMRSFKHKLRRSISRRSRRHRKRGGQRGGYAQYQNNLPLTPIFKVAGVNLPANQLALANPPPITKLSNCVNCVDNYNHYTNKGFPSRGH